MNVEIDMKKFVIGKPFATKVAFRETCFGICEKEGKILLTQKVVKNEISLVGGGIEEGESHCETLNREFKEETGYKVRDIKELCEVDCYWLAAGKYPMRSFAFFYIVEVDEDFSAPTEEGHKALWVDVLKAKKLCPLPYHQKALEYYINRNERV